MACMLKKAGRTAKLSEISDSGTIVIKIWGTFELVGFMCTCLEIHYISKTAACTVKRSEIWESWTLLTHGLHLSL